MPLTLQDTAVLVEPATVGVKVCVLPSRTEDVVGVTVTLTEEGAGVGGGADGLTEVETPPLQPKVHAAVARRMRFARAGKRCDCAALQELPPALCERGRMPRRNAGEGPASRDVGGARPRFAETIAAISVSSSNSKS